jgi:Ras family protein T1
MAYLGFFDPDHTKALTLKKRAAKKNQRDVFLCYVFGAAGSGKTSIMKSFTKNKFKKEYTPTTTPYSVVNSVEIGGEEKYLIVI